MMEGKVVTNEMIGPAAKTFILRNFNDQGMNKSIVALSSSRGTSYSTYIDVYDQLKRTYHQLREELSIRLYEAPLHSLNKAEINLIRARLPVVISESEV